MTNQIDWRAKAAIRSGSLRGRSEMLRSSRQAMRSQSRGHHIVDPLERSTLLWKDQKGPLPSDQDWNFFKGNTENIILRGKRFFYYYYLEDTLAVKRAWAPPWTKLNWTELALNWTDQNWTGTKLNWTGTEQNWTELNWTGTNKTELNWHWIGLNWTDTEHNSTEVNWTGTELNWHWYKLTIGAQ